LSYPVCDVSSLLLVDIFGIFCECDSPEIATDACQIPAVKGQSSDTAVELIYFRWLSGTLQPLSAYTCMLCSGHFWFTFHFGKNKRLFAVLKFLLSKCSTEHQWSEYKFRGEGMLVWLRLPTLWLFWAPCCNFWELKVRECF